MLYSVLVQELDALADERDNTARTALAVLENRKNDVAVERVKYAMYTVKVLLSQATVNLTADTTIDSKRFVEEFRSVEHVFHLLAKCYIFLKLGHK